MLPKNDHGCCIFSGDGASRCNRVPTPPRVHGVHTSQRYRVSHLPGVHGVHTSRRYRVSRDTGIPHLPVVHGIHALTDRKHQRDACVNYMHKHQLYPHITSNTKWECSQYLMHSSCSVQLTYMQQIKTPSPHLPHPLYVCLD